MSSSKNFRLVRETDRHFVNCVRLSSGGIVYQVVDKLDLVLDGPMFPFWEMAYAVADQRNRDHREAAA